MILRVIYGLPGYLRHPLTVPECRAMLRQRLQEREKNFLDLLRRTVYTNPVSPYYTLLRLAGCEYGDLERMVQQDGLENTLQVLFRKGVYLTVDEYKGRRPAVRGSTTIESDPGRLRNPLSVPHLWGSTSGSRGSATRIQLDLACIRDRAVNMFLTLDARGGAHWRNAIWSTRGIAPMLWHSSYGTPVERWFLLADPRTFDLQSKFGWTIQVLTWTSRLAGVPLPYPEFVPADKPQEVMSWIQKTLGAGEFPHLWLPPSSAVRLCQEADKTGISLAGVHFSLIGEPITEARLAVIRQAGADGVPDYGSADSGGSVSSGCLAPEEPDDVHLFNDLNAIIQVDGSPFPKGALLISSLRSTTPFVFINLSMGDSATISERKCGCPMEALGWHTHLHTIRSFEKLSAGGVTFEDAEIIPLLEEVLPRTFGGGPTDYQLIEEEAQDGQPRLCLLVNPSIGPVDLEALSKTFLDAIGSSSDVKRDMVEHWRQTGCLRVERRAPNLTASGKILHLVAAPPAGKGDAP